MQAVHPRLQNETRQGEWAEDVDRFVPLRRHQRRPDCARRKKATSGTSGMHRRRDKRNYL